MLSPPSSNTGLNVGMDMDTGPFTFYHNAHVGAVAGTGVGPSSAANKTNGTRLRASCDACQSVKVKCSQDKPSCRRCSRIGLGCVYSPLRRMGRPKKRASAAPSAASSSPPTDSATPMSQSRSHDARRRRHATTTTTTTTPSPASVSQPQLAGHDSDGMGNDFGAGISFGPDNNGLGANGMNHGGMLSGASDGALAGPYPATLLEDRPMTAPFPNDGLLSPSTRLDGPSASTRQQPRLPTSSLAALLGFDSQAGTQREQSPAADDGGSQTITQAGSCYLAVLQRLTRLEATLTTVPRPPRLDVILSAERDMRALKDRISACRSHHRRNSETAPSPKAPGGRSCADTHGPALVVLALLADRVTALLEDLFRRAAQSSHAVDQAARGAAAAWLHGPPPAADISSPAAERRYERSVRASLPRGISCPVPEADCALAVGGYEVDDGEVKGRAVRRILGRRVGALGAMLGDLGGYLVGAAGHEGEGEGGSSLLLGSVEGSRDVSRTAAASMVDDLCKRVEMLRGRIELAGH